VVQWKCGVHSQKQQSDMRRGGEGEGEGERGRVKEKGEACSFC